MESLVELGGITAISRRLKSTRMNGLAMRSYPSDLDELENAPAERVGLSIETIGKIERGVAAPSFDTVERIAAALGLPALALFGVGEEATPEGERGRLLARINATLAGMNEDQMARAAKMLEAFVGR